jgi:TnpA family transposase
MPFRKEWRKLVVEPDGKINRRLYETATLAHVRNKLRSGDVWVDRSSSYRRFDSYLVPMATATPIAKGLGLPDSAGRVAEQPRDLADQRLKGFERQLRKGQLEGVAMVGDRLRITPISNTTPPDAKALAERLYGLLPRIRVTELLHEVARETGFLSAFTNLRTGRTSDNESGPRRHPGGCHQPWAIAHVSSQRGRHARPASRAKDAYIRDDCYSTALAHLINAHHILPFSQVWGHGTTSSSDGQFFRGRKRGASGGDINARYGVDPGFSFYTHVSDQHGPFHAKVSAATHEAPYVLDGLLHHGSVLRIDEHFTDTGGATDHVFALCSMLGFRFCPRLRDFPDRRLVSIASPGTYPTLAPLLGKRLRIDVVREHWDEIVRLVASTSSGHVLPPPCSGSLPPTSARTKSIWRFRRSERSSARCSCWTGSRIPR